jgi:hypothetical protein
MLGHEITAGGTIGLVSDLPVTMVEIRDTGSATVVTTIASGATITAPDAGELVYVVVIRPESEQAEVTLTLTS